MLYIRLQKPCAHLWVVLEWGIVAVNVVVVVWHKTLCERKFHDNMSIHELITRRRGSDINFNSCFYSKTVGIFTNWSTENEKIFDVIFIFPMPTIEYCCGKCSFSSCWTHAIHCARKSVMKMSNHEVFISERNI